MSGNQKGFTLIELIVVIVILGVLAATALPKFIDLSGDARTAVIQGVEGGMRGANALVYAKAANTAGAFGAGPTSVTIASGITVSVAYGFATTAAELRKAMDLSPTATFDTTTAALEVRHAGASDPANCKVTYAAATSLAVPPTYTLTTSGC